MLQDPTSFTLGDPVSTHDVKPIFHNAKFCVGGLSQCKDPTQNFALGILVNMLVPKNAKICITPNANFKICVTPNANVSRWPCTFHFVGVEYYLRYPMRTRFSVEYELLLYLSVIRRL